MKLILSAALALAMTACALVPTVKSDPDKLKSELRGSTIEVWAYVSPSARFFTPADAPGLGWLSVAVADMLLSPKASGPDSSIQSDVIAKVLSGQLQQTYQAGATKQGSKPLPPMPKEPLAKKVWPESQYILEVAVLGHMFAYRPLAWSTYQYAIDAQARLIRTSDSAVLWANTCSVNPRGGDERLQANKNDFASQNVGKVKSILEYGAQLCAAELAQSISGK